MTSVNMRILFCVLDLFTSGEGCTQKCVKRVVIGATASIEYTKGGAPL